VRVVDAHARLALDRRDEVLVDGEGPDGGGAVAAVALVVHEGPRHLDLGEGVVHVGPGVGRRPDDTRLRERRDAAAEPVELAAVWIRAPERREEDPIALGAHARQIDGAEDEAAARPAPHVDGADASLGYGPPLDVWARSPPARRMSRSRAVRTPGAEKRRPRRGPQLLSRSAAARAALRR